MAFINLQNVSLEYPVYNTHGTSLRHKFINFSTGGYIAKDAKKSTIVRALTDINLELHTGDRLGIMGHNGAGKTTLLRCIAGIYAPTFGKIVRKGTIASLIEIGAGLEPELSGFDNIRRLLYLRGFKPTDVSNLTESVVEFTELNDFLSLPVRTYSSGMMMRLMFAVATVSNTDILVLDEFFSAGDSSFKEKADKRLTQNIQNASILVFASHSEALLKKMCNRFVRLEHGKLEEVAE